MLYQDVEEYYHLETNKDMEGQTSGSLGATGKFAFWGLLNWPPFFRSEAQRPVLPSLRLVRCAALIPASESSGGQANDRLRTVGRIPLKRTNPRGPKPNLKFSAGSCYAGFSSKKGGEGRKAAKKGGNPCLGLVVPSSFCP